MFTIPVADILGRPGHFRDVGVDEPLDGVHTEMASVGDTPVSARLRIESVVEGLLATGPIVGATTLRCSRCLREFGSRVEVEVCELFTTPGHHVDDAYRVQGAEIDLEPMLRDALVLALPLNPVCREDCRGMCARCGRDLNEVQCDCSDDDVDPRWSQLEELRARLEGRERAPVES